jgi:hypothetical protein
VLETTVPLATDYRATVSIGWSSGGSGVRAPARHAMQSLHIVFLDENCEEILRVLYNDSWIDYTGEKKVQFRGERSRVVASGAQSLPADGEAEILAERVGGRARVFWNGELFAVGDVADRARLAMIRIMAEHVVYVRFDEASHFGSLAVGRFELVSLD